MEFERQPPNVDPCSYIWDIGIVECRFKLSHDDTRAKFSVKLTRFERYIHRGARLKIQLRREQ